MKLKNPMVLVLAGQAVALVGAVVVFAVSQSHAAPKRSHHAEAEEAEQEEAPKKHPKHAAKEEEEAPPPAEEPSAPGHHGRRAESEARPPVAAEPTEPPPAAHEATQNAAADETPFEGLLKSLMAGNGRFIEGAVKQRDALALRDATAEADRASVVVVTCTDSRVAPELVFDQPLGVFEVVRVPGAQLDAAGVKMVEAAVKRLHAQAVLVMGHLGCDHVEEARAKAPAKAPRKVTSLPAALAGLKKGDVEHEATARSVDFTVRTLRRNSRFLAADRELTVLRLIYAPKTGAVTWLDAE